MGNFLLNLLGVGGTAATGAVDDMQLISAQVLGAPAANVTFSSIPGTFRHLFIEFIAQSDNAGTKGLFIQFNADTGANYQHQTLGADHTTVFAGRSTGAANGFVGNLAGTGSTPFTTGTIFLPYYTTTTQKKTAIAMTTTGTNIITFRCDSMWETANAAITQVLFFVESAANLVTNSSFSLYGIT